VTAPAAAAPGDPLLDGLFGDGVLAATAPVGEDEGGLFPEERLLVASAVAKRRREFAAARRCARALLARLDEPPRPLLRGPDREPIWPDGVVGSISHADALVAVAVARPAAALGLGIDVEPDEPLERPLWRKICTDAELQRLPGSDDGQRGRSARLVFSAKEALYKCVFPHARRFIGFQEVEIALAPDGRWAAAMPADVCAALPARAAFAGTFLRRDGWILTGAALAPGSGSREETIG
jgi:4'-phosphopantetheinyl transferase EntD